MTAAVVVLAVAVLGLGAMLLYAIHLNVLAHNEIRGLNAALDAAQMRDAQANGLMPQTATGTPIHDAVSRRLRVVPTAADVLYAGPVAGGEG